MTPEAKVKAMIRNKLKGFDVWYDMPVPSGYGRSTLDFICCYRGRFFAIEAKAPGKNVTARQLNTMRSINEAGGVAFVVHNIEEMETVLAWMKLSGVTDATG